MIWRISKRAFSLSKKRHIWHHHLKNRAVSFCPVYHFACYLPHKCDETVTFVCLFVYLILYVPSTIFQLLRDRSS